MRYWRVQRLAGHVDGKPSWEQVHLLRYFVRDKAVLEVARLKRANPHRIYRVILGQGGK